MYFTPNKYPIITQNNLELLIQNKIEESLHLDYKDPRALINNAEIAKDISSFANTDGGNIIYGMKEVENKPTEIIPLNEEGLREKIDQIAHTGIDPPLNIKIWPVDVNVDGNLGQVFIIYIPKKFPYLHLAKKKNRFYKRTNFTSTPMQRYEIELAYKQWLEITESLNYRISQIEKEFLKEIGQRHYKFIFTISPTQKTENLFEINTEVRKFLYDEFPQTPINNYNLFSKGSRNELPNFRQNSIFFKSILGFHNADCLIRINGIIIYVLHFYNFSEGELKKTIGENNFPMDYYGRLKRGIILNERKFDRTFFIDYFLGLLNFLVNFYTKLGYIETIHIKLQVQGALQEWTEHITGNRFLQTKIEKIENE
ncbi:MAG: helix-turn-helix domain-containing protein [Promethearchaeota archaeon]